MRVLPLPHPQRLPEGEVAKMGEDVGKVGEEDRGKYLIVGIMRQLVWSEILLR